MSSLVFGIDGSLVLSYVFYGFLSCGTNGLNQ